jgi:hypothetical protein
LREDVELLVTEQVIAHPRCIAVLALGA